MKINNFKNSLFILNLLFPLTAHAGGYSLDDCIQWALESKKTILSSNLGVELAEKDFKSSYSGLLPSIQAYSNRSYTQFSERVDIIPIFNDTIYTSSTENLSAGVSLNQTLYDGGRSFNQVKNSKENLKIARLNQRISKIQVIQNVIKAYYGLLKAQQLYEVAEKNLEMSNQQVSLISKQFDLGVIKKTDLLKARVSLGQAKVDLLNKKTNLSNSRRILFNSIGIQDFGQKITALEETWSLPNIPSSADILRFLKTKNPSLLISDIQIYLGGLNYKTARALRLPSLNTSLTYSANGTTINELQNALKEDWSLGMNLSLSIPIYTGKSLYLNQQKTKIFIKQAEYDYVTRLNDLRVQAELIRESLNNYAEIIPLNESVVNSAEEDLKLVTKRYTLGSVTILEVLDAQVSLIRSNSTLINIIHDARIQESNLKGLLGLLDFEYISREN
jgi:outer membrane protein|tara:strand:- start:6345 stop:7682 length:1338 start_codon:yes stop_codon:yes gene_type:complete